MKKTNYIYSVLAPVVGLGFTLPAPATFARAGMGLAALLSFRREGVKTAIAATLLATGLLTSAEAEGTINFTLSIPGGAYAFADGGGISGYANLSYNTLGNTFNIQSVDITTTPGTQFPTGFEFRYNVAGQPDTLANEAVGGPVGDTYLLSLFDNSGTRDLIVPWEGIADTSLLDTSIGFNYEADNTFGTRSFFTTTTVPEPSTIALTGVGTTAVLIARRRKTGTPLG